MSKKIDVLKHAFDLGFVCWYISKGYWGCQQGKCLGENFKRSQRGEKLLPFRYKDKGSLATVGRNKAVADIGKMRFQGFLGWFIWIAVHLLFLIGFRNKLVVLTNWLWNYFKYDKGIRLIIRPFVKDNDPVTKKLELEKSE